jgi:hypothetical protein
MKIVGPKGKDVTGDWRKLHNVELHGVYSSCIAVGDQIKMRCAGHMADMGGRILLVNNLQEKGLL